jgi:hypothetical protein
MHAASASRKATQRMYEALVCHPKHPICSRTVRVLGGAPAIFLGAGPKRRVPASSLSSTIAFEVCFRSLDFGYVAVQAFFSQSLINHLVTTPHRGAAIPSLILAPTTGPTYPQL